MIAGTEQFAAVALTIATLVCWVAWLALVPAPVRAVAYQRLTFKAVTPHTPTSGVTRSAVARPRAADQPLHQDRG